MQHATNFRKMLVPNAWPQPLPEAGAERTLEAVGCRPMFK